MNSRDIRNLFISFFGERGHRHVPSSSLIPPPDRGIMLTTAGMVQMWPYFMGLDTPPAKRLTSIQKCFRTSDIEEVGDVRHCTFFEMLGNFSVGDYFKGDAEARTGAIPWAWELLTGPQPKGLGLSKDRIWATIFQDDEEAFELWRKVGVPRERIARFGEKYNYWFMGAVGPCGPNSEINYDFGAGQGCGQPDCRPNCENPMPDGSGPCDRFIEFWNLVFMTLFQSEDGSRRPLPQSNVDTGGGLERWLMPVLWEAGLDWEGKAKRWERPPTIFDSDLFQPILAKVGELSGKSYYEASVPEQRAMRVVADHARGATFLLADGVTPSNEDRGYVPRRLIRRGTSFGQRLQQGCQFLEETAKVVIEQMGLQHENLMQRRDFVLRTLQSEESKFFQTLERGTAILNGMVSFRKTKAGSLPELISSFGQHHPASIPEAVEVLKQHGLSGWKSSGSLEEQIGENMAAIQVQRVVEKALEFGPSYLGNLDSWPNELSAEELFHLFDTLGFPPELAKEIAGDQGLGADLEGFEGLMDEHRARSRAGSRFDAGAERVQTYVELSLPPTEFLGYETTRLFATVSAFLLDGTTVVRSLTPAAAADHRVEVVLTQTPFYAEGGGQVGDRGEFVWRDGRFVVEDTQAVGEGGIVSHIGRLESGTLNVGAVVEARVDEGLRADTMRNHTATHILHAALRQVLGSQARQAGSLVTPDRLRFDFTHLEAMTPDQVREVEALANQAVRENIPVHIHYQSYEEALQGGALAFFGDKYAETVRVVGICDHSDAEPEPVEACFSKELCGGTHVHASGEVGTIIVTAESSIGAGLRRIEAVTGRAAAERLREQEDLLGKLSATLRVPALEIEGRIEAMRGRIEELEKQLQATERRLARSVFEGGPSGGEPELVIDGVAVEIKKLPDVPSADFLRDVGDSLKQRHPSAVVLLGAVIDGKPSFVAMVTPDVAQRVPAGDIVRVAAREAGGGGGGRPELAQGGGIDPSKLDAALAAGRKLIEEKLAG